ncbi:MAG TPA: type II toxin-antitoxin system VapC family toxin [Caulobacteraceae bacterium]|jgi:PIN domain nuclease of toxin-antitoxin system|nr:type II toxin-antitoxin system VapC family toxin [Caulobacteraceae bacterium]
MRLLLDTHILLWAATWTQDGRSPLPAAAAGLIEDQTNEILFSVASVWEIAIKRALKRTTFSLDPAWFRQRLLRNNYQELGITGPHAIAVAALPPLHEDPFDRLLVAQAQVEGLTLLTADDALSRYGSAVRRV